MLCFLNENGVVLYDSTQYLLHLPTVGVDTTSIGTVYVVTDESDFEVHFEGRDADMYGIVTNNGEEWTTSDSYNNFSIYKKIILDNKEYNLYPIRISCKLPDAEDTLSTQSALATIVVKDKASIQIITEFVECNTSELLVKNFISENIDKYLVNACDCHASNAENPDLVMYNRKLKELLMTRTLATGTYNDLHNTLKLFGFDQMKVYDVLKDIDQNITLRDSSIISSSYIIENFVKSYDIVLAIQMYKYGFLKGVHLTDSIVPEFESDIRYTEVNDNKFVDAMIHPIAEALDETNEGTMTLTGQNNFTQPAEPQDGFDLASIAPIFDKREPAYKIYPEIVPYINTIDGTDTVSRDEIQQKTSIIKKILKESFSILFNTIISCSIEDASYSNNLKATSHASESSPVLYDDTVVSMDDYIENIKIVAPDGTSSKSLTEWISEHNHLTLKEAEFDVKLTNVDGAKIEHRIDENYNYASNATISTQSTGDFGKYNYWHYHSAAASLELSFQNIAGKYSDFRYIEIFAINKLNKKYSTIEENIKECKENNEGKGYTHSLHDKVGSVSDIVLLDDIGTWDVTINIYTNTNEMPVFKYSFEVKVDNGISSPSIYRLKNTSTLSDVLSTSSEKQIVDIFHNDTFHSHYLNADPSIVDSIADYYTKSFSGKYTNVMKTTELSTQISYIASPKNDIVSVKATNDSIIIDIAGESERFSLNTYLPVLSDMINEYIVEKIPDATVALNIHRNSSKVEVDYMPDDTAPLYISIIEVRKETEVHFKYEDNIKHAEEHIFYEPAWYIVGADILKGESIAKRDLNQDTLYIIKNSNGLYCDNMNAYQIIFKHDEPILNIPTSGMLFDYDTISDVKNIICNYYNNFEYYNIRIKK